MQAIPVRTQVQAKSLLTTKDNRSASSKGKLLYQNIIESNSKEAFVKQELNKYTFAQQQELADQLIEEAGPKGIEILTETPDGQYALRAIHDVASNETGNLVREVQLTQGNTAVNYTRIGENAPITKAFQAKLVKHIPKTSVSRDLVDPVRYNGSGPATRRSDDRLYIDGINITDVRQGNIGDCYFIATIASVAHLDPNLIANAITDNGDGTYSVRLFDQTGRPQYITVDADLYRYANGTPIYGRGTNPREIWIPIIEKAYAQMRGGYDQIGHGGSPADAIHALTGYSAKSVRHSHHNHKSMYSKISEAINNHRPVVASTYGGGTSAYDRVGLAQTHAYTVIGVETTNYGMHNRGHQQWVILRNPWAHAEFGNPSTSTSPFPHGGSYETDVDLNGDGRPDGDDGCFRMKIEDYMTLFRATTIAN